MEQFRFLISSLDRKKKTISNGTVFKRKNRAAINDQALISTSEANRPSLYSSVEDFLAKNRPYLVEQDDNSADKGNADHAIVVSKTVNGTIQVVEFVLDRKRKTITNSTFYKKKVGWTNDAKKAPLTTSETTQPSKYSSVEDFLAKNRPSQVVDPEAGGADVDLLWDARRFF